MGEVFNSMTINDGTPPKLYAILPRARGYAVVGAK